MRFNTNYLSALCAATFLLFTAVNVSANDDNPLAKAAKGENTVIVLVTKEPVTTRVKTSMNYQIRSSKLTCNNNPIIEAVTTLELSEIQSLDMQLIEIELEEASPNKSMYSVLTSL